MDTTEPTAELRRNVYDNEEIEWVVRPRKTARLLSNGLSSVVGGVVGGAVLGGVTFVALTFFSAAFASMGLFLSAIPVAVVVFSLYFLWSLREQVLLLAFGTTEYAATDARLIEFGGVFGRRMSSVPLEGVQDTQYEVSTVENLFDVGTVTVDTDRGYEAVRFPYTSGPADFAREVNSLAKRARTEGTPDLGDHGTYEPGEGIEDETPSDGLADNLYPDEELLWVVTRDKTSQLLTDLPGVVVGAFVTGLVFGAIAGGAAFGLTQSTSTAVRAGVVVGAVTAFLNFVVSAVSYYRGSTQYAATDRRVMEYQGRFGKHFDSVPLVGVQDAEYGVSFTENLFDVGTVTVDTDRGYEGLSLSNVPNPPDVSREISQLGNSSIADRETIDPGEVSVGDGVDPTEPSSDLRKNLHDDERLVWTVTPDEGARLSKNLVQGIPSAAVGGVVVGAIVGVVAAGTVGPGLAVAVGGLAFVGVVFLAVYGTLKQYLFDTTEYAMTDDRLVEYSGSFGRELSGVPLEGVQDAEYRTSFVEDRFGVGDVTVDVHPGYDGVVLHAVADPGAVAREISEIANAYRLSDTEVAAGEAADSGVDAGPTTVDGAAEADGSRSGDGSTSTLPRASAHKLCSGCEAEIDVRSTYCPDCGAEQPVPNASPEANCLDCGAAVGVDDGFCRACGVGTPVPGAEDA